MKRVHHSKIRENWKTNLLYAACVATICSGISFLVGYAINSPFPSAKEFLPNFIIFGAFVGYLIPYLQERWE